MTTLTFYFQVHQPFRVRPYQYDEIGKNHAFFDDWLNEDVVKRVTSLCYLPMNDVLSRAIDRTDGAVKCAFSISGTALRQFELWAPEALESFAELAEKRDSVEFFCETSRHSLAALADEEEFALQVDQQRALLKKHFGVTPTTFRNTELILSPDVARQVEALGFDLLVGEGADGLLRRPHEPARHPGQLFHAEGVPGLPILLRDYPFSDDIAFRFSNQGWEEYPLFAPTFLRWLEELPEERRVVGLFMDYETFGEHQPKSTGVFEFMDELLDLVAAHVRIDFSCPRELPARLHAPVELPFDRPYSWADAERDLSAWLANPMQRSAHEAIYELGPRARAAGGELAETWRDLTTSDHVYYMSTSADTDGDVHEYFSPYPSPHDAYVTVMNALEDLRRRV
ncbi:MAG: glycoside hydrolase family 57 protein [Planctomycetota bacterium]